MKNKKGFTLVEMMAVVLIIAGLAAIAYPAYTKVINRARTAEAFSLIEIVREAQQRSAVVNGHFFPQFTNAHISGRTRLIKANDVSVETGKLKRGLYTVSMLFHADSHGNKTLNCIRVDYGSDSSTPIFTIYTHIQDSRIWCKEIDDGNGICGTIHSLENINTLDCDD